MISATDGRDNRFRLIHALFLTILIVVIAGTGCTQANDAPIEKKATPANVSIEVWPAENEVLQADSKPTGREVAGGRPEIEVGHAS